MVNDASAAAWAEYKVGAGQGSADFVMVTLGTGIGGGFIFDGLLFTGSAGISRPRSVTWSSIPVGSSAPAVGLGCWERYASGVGLGRIARERALEGGVAAAVELAGGDRRGR